MAIVTNTINYLDGDVVLEAFFAFDDAISAPRPAVLIHHTWVGRDGFVEGKARKIAELGYLGFAIDMYGKGILGASPEENAKLMAPFMENRALLRKRVLAGFTAIKQLPWTDQNKIAAIGFCFGGLCALDLARAGADLKGVISFHGLLKAPAGVEACAVKAKILALHGHDDPLVKPEQVLAFQQEMTAAGADWQVHSYGHTVHGFTNPAANNPQFGTVYNADADRRSWRTLGNFLEEILV